MEHRFACIPLLGADRSRFLAADKRLWKGIGLRYFVLSACMCGCSDCLHFLPYHAMMRKTGKEPSIYDEICYVCIALAIAEQATNAALRVLSVVIELL